MRLRVIPRGIQDPTSRVMGLDPTSKYVPEQDGSGQHIALAGREQDPASRMAWEWDE